MNGFLPAPAACSLAGLSVLLCAVGPSGPCVGQQHAFVGRVLGENGDAVAGAAVTARWRRAPELPGLTGWTLGSPDGLGSEGAATASDADGRFRFDLPERGPVALVARDASGARQSQRRFPVMAGQFVELRLRPARIIRGRATDELGAPLAELALEPVASTWARCEITAYPIERVRIRADATGSFRHALEHAFFAAPMYEPVVELRPADPALRFARPVTLRPPWDLPRLLLSARPKPVVRGVLQDVAGKPIANARVYEMTAPWCATRTDEHGRFDMPARRKRGLAFVADGFAYAPAPKDFSRRLDLEGFVVKVIPSRRVKARLVDGRGAPLAGCDVLWSSRRRSEPPLEWLAKTDGDGRLVVAGAPVLAPTSGFVRHDGRWRRFLRRTFSRHEDLGDLAVTWRTLDGQVVDDHGVPLRGVRVLAIEASTIELSSRVCWVTYTDHGGRFRLPSLPRQPFEVVAEAGVRGLAQVSVGPDDERCEVRLPAGGSVVVEVCDAAGREAAGCRVTLSGSRSFGQPATPITDLTALFGFTDERGVVRFGGLPDRSWRVTVHRLEGGELSVGRASLDGVGTATVVLARSR